MEGGRRSFVLARWILQIVCNKVYYLIEDFTTFCEDMCCLNLVHIEGRMTPVARMFPHFLHRSSM